MTEAKAPYITATSPTVTLEFVTYHPQSFLGYNKETGQIIHIIGLTTRGHWLSDRGYLYPAEVITNDLTEYARQKMEDAHDHAETLADALGTLF